MSEDRTPRIIAPTEPTLNIDDGPGIRRSRSREDRKGEPRAKNRRSRLDRDWPARTDDEDEQRSSHDRVHFPLFP
jgi:hypothetical protein